MPPQAVCDLQGILLAKRVQAKIIGFTVRPSGPCLCLPIAASNTEWIILGEGHSVAPLSWREALENSKQ